MAEAIQLDYRAGRTVYFLLRDSQGRVWNGASFEAYATANYATYPITAAEQGSASGYFTAAWPSVSAGVYSVVGKDQAGASPAESDISVGWDNVIWDGSQVLSANAIADAVLSRDVDNVEAGAAIHSLCSAVLKLVSKFDIGSGTTGNAITYRTDGTTQHMKQVKTTNSSLTPTQVLDAAVAP